MKPLTESDIRASFVNLTPTEAERVVLPGLHEVMWDEREYLGWRDPSGPRGYVVMWRDDDIVGFMLRAAQTQGRGTAICSLCSTQQPGGQVTMFTAPRAGAAGRAGHSVGTHICADLACSMLIRITPPAHEWQPDPGWVVAQRSQRLTERLTSFSSRVLDASA